MAGFSSQLGLLLWKNLTLRKRQKIRMSVELIWPVIIIMILALVRKDTMPTKFHECHFLSKAMPSGGLLPFMQSFICDFSNKCHENTTYGEIQGQVNNFQDAGLTQLVADLSKILANETTVKSFLKLIEYFNKLNDLIPGVNGLEESTSISNYLTDPAKASRALQDNVGLSPQAAEKILNTGVDSGEILTVLNPDTLKSLQCDTNESPTIVSAELCGLNKKEYAQISSILVGQLDSNKLTSVVRNLSSQVGGTQWTPGIPPAFNDLLTNSTLLVEYLVNDIGLTPQEAQLLVDSMNNPDTVLLFLSGSDMRSVVCNTTKLADYIDATDPADLEDLSETLCNMSDSELDQLSEVIYNLTDLEALQNAINKTELWKHYEEILRDMRIIADQIQNLDSVDDLINDLKAIVNNNDTGQLLCGSVGGLLGSANVSLDGSGQKGAFSSLKSRPPPPTKRRPKEDEENEDEENADDITVEAYDDSSNNTDGVREDCEWLQNVKNSDYGDFIWKSLKPMVQGYILFTPNTVATRKIMNEAVQPLSSIVLLQDLAYKWLNISPTIHKFLENSTISGLYENLAEQPNFAEQMTGLLNSTDSTDDQLALIRTVLAGSQLPFNGSDSSNATSKWLEAVNGLDKFATLIVDVLKCVELDKLRGYNTTKEFNEAAKALQGNHTLWGGAVFVDFNTSFESDVIPRHVKYYLRMDSSMVPNTGKVKSSLWSPGARSNLFLSGKYIMGGFVFLQDMFEQGIIKASVGIKDVGAGTFIQEFPYPCYSEDTFVQSLGAMLPLLMVMSWVFSVSMIIKNIVLEKELRLKEVMKVMGMGNAVHWVAWFIDSFLMMFISTLILTLVLKVGNILILTNTFVLIFMLLSFSVSTIALCFLISTIFSRANLAAACGAVIFFLSYIPYTMAYSFDEVLPYSVKLLLCLSNTIAFGYGSMYLTLFEIQGKGLSWTTLGVVPLTAGAGLTSGEIILMMWVDTFIYLILTWYIEGVAPGTYGMPRPWYFPIQRSYWCGSKTVDAAEIELIPTTPGDIAADTSDLEPEPTHLTLGASIKSMYKVYKTGKKLAVNNLSLNFYEGQITSFLGHNGAGKTTTMSILTGLFPPTAGTAYIYGKDITTDITSIRKSLGMCPQHNVLFKDLTVAEHLWFYAKVKGATDKEVAVEMEEMLNHLNIPHKRHEMTDKLSGGMKRKLSIAMAFVAGSKTVILDEPTAGVDPYARREIWELLGRYKEGRTIIMSTHHMDEADILGDRIAIISAGQLRCAGSSLFLKSRFGSGYYLVLNKYVPGDDVLVSPEQMEPLYETVASLPLVAPQPIAGMGVVGAAETKQDLPDGQAVAPMEVKVDLGPGVECDLPAKKDTPPVDIPDTGSCHEPTVSRFIQSYIPGASLCENLGKELSYMLPHSSTQPGTLEFLFRELEMFKDRLYVGSFGISDTSLEEVFLTVTDDVGIVNAAGRTEGEDDGNLPRPFMGRGSLRRRDYVLPAKSNSIKVRRLRALSNVDVTPLIDNEEIDPDHEWGFSEVDGAENMCYNAANEEVSFQDTNQTQEASAENQQVKGHDGQNGVVRQDSCNGLQRQSSQDGRQRQNSRAELSRQDSRSGPQRQDSRPELSRQDSRPGMTRKTSRMKTNKRQASKQLIRTVSRLAMEDQQANVPVANVRMPDLESSEPCAKDLSGRRVEGFHLIRRQFYALFIKRFHHFRRSKKGFFAQVILPAVFVCLAMLFTTLFPPSLQPDNLPLVPWLTGTPNYIFYSNDSPNETLAKGMDDSFVENNPGVGTICMADNPFDVNGYDCDPSSVSDWHAPAMDPELRAQFDAGNLTCNCIGYGFEDCMEGAEGPSPPEKHVPSTDILQDFSETDISQFIRITTLKYTWERFGGFSFLETDNTSSLTQNISNDVLGSLDPSAYIDNSTLQDIYAVVLSLARLKNVQVWWDNNGFHALPAYMNVGNNMLLRGQVPASERASYGISAYNYPINFTSEQLTEKAMKQLPINLATAIFIVFALAFVPASFAVFLIDERESKAKHLQIVSGINPTTYWVTSLIWDLLNYLIPAVLTILIFLCFKQEAYISAEAAPATILLLVMYGWSITPMTYAASFLFNTPSTAYLSLACGNMLLGIVTITTTFMLEFLASDNPSMEATNESLKKLFLIFPPFCLGRGLMDMSSNALTAEFGAAFGQEVEATYPLDWDIVGRNIFALACSGVFFCALTLLIEYKFLLKPRHIKSKEPQSGQEDDDVVRERQRVLTGGAKDDVIRTENLTKRYNTSHGTHMAVDRMCFGIPKGECFGLLGVNGAGKTTTFKMLTGDTRVTSGSAYVNGFSILDQMKNVSQSIGYCPQFDALNNLLTAEEHLAFYARLRGVPEDDLEKVIDWGIKRLGLTEYAKRVAGTYSGGNKRKLSTAIALIGDPPVIFLDEPTTGMDPKARRFLWNRITSIVKEGRSVVLTSHSMEECEALCTRVAIMVNGRFKCIGSTQHLKSKFGDGYTITIRVGGDPPRMEPLMVYLATAFPRITLRERHFNMLEYQLPTESTSLAKVFGAFDAKKQLYNIEDYSVSQTTLDQVFINFAKEQKTGDEVDAHNQPNPQAGMAVVNIHNERQQVVMATDLQQVQIIPENSTIGGFAFAAANVYGGLISHDHTAESAVYNQIAPTAIPLSGAQVMLQPMLHGSRGMDGAYAFANPLYRDGNNTEPLNANNCQTGTVGACAAPPPTHTPNVNLPPYRKNSDHHSRSSSSGDGDKSEDEVTDDCLVPRECQDAISPPTSGGRASDDSMNFFPLSEFEETSAF